MVEGIWEGIWEGGTFRGGGSCGVGVVGGCGQRAGVASKGGVVYFLQVASSYQLSSLLKRKISPSPSFLFLSRLTLFAVKKQPYTRSNLVPT